MKEYTKREKLFSVAVVATLLMAGFAAFMAVSSSDGDSVTAPLDLLGDDPLSIEVTEEEYNSVHDLLASEGMSEPEILENIGTWDNTGMMIIQPMALGLVAGLVIGLAVGITIGKIWGSFSGGAPAADAEELRAELRYRLASDLHNTYNAAAGMFQRLLLNDVNILRFTQAYWSLQMDAVVNSIYKPNSYITDIDQMIEDAGVVSNLSTIKQNMNQSLNMMSYAERTADWYGADSATYGSRIASGWVYGTNEWFGNSSNVYMTLGDYVYASATNYRVYIDIVTDMEMISTLPDTNAMYITNSAPVTITSAEGTEYVLQPGRNNIGSTGMGLAAGWYDLAPNCGYISPNLLPSLSINGIVPTTGFVLHNGSSYALGYKIADGYRVINGGNIYDVGSVDFAVRFQDAGGNTEILKSEDGSGNSILTGALDAYSRIWDTYEDIFTGTRNAAQLTWSVLDVLEVQTGSYVIRPSAITAGFNTNLNLPLPVQTAAVVAAMRQLIDMGVDADPSKITISKESLDESMYVYGNIYYQGILIAENAVYTPLFYGTESKMLHTGTQTLTESETAFLIVYATDVPNMASFVPVPDQYQIVELAGNLAQLDVFEIWAAGSSVTTFTFEILEAQYLGVFDFGFSHRPAVGVQDSSVNLWMGIAIFFMGLSALLAGIPIKLSSPWILIIGAIVMLLGVLQITTGVVSGFFNGLSDFLNNPLGGWFK